MSNKPSLDEALAAWRRVDPLESPGDEAALARILKHAEATSSGPQVSRRTLQLRGGWMLGGAVAASVTVALLLAGGPGRAPTPDATPAPAMTAAQAGEADGAAFALLYTPTPEEEYLL